MAVYRSSEDVSFTSPKPVIPVSATQEAPMQFGERFMAAAGASIVAASVVNPLDVVKTRMQAQAAASSASAVDAQRTLFEVRRHLNRSLHTSDAAVAELPELAMHHTGSSSPAMDNRSYRWSSRRFGITQCPPSCVIRQAPTTATSCAPSCTTYTSMGDAFRKIIRQEGLTALWRGTSTSLLMSVPMVGIYMPLYDYFLATWSPKAGAYAPMLAGIVSRVVAVFCVAPFELIRTRQQVLQGHTRAGKLSVLEAAKMHAASSAVVTSSRTRAAVRQVTGLWTGVSATLLRDVPFSALYWGMLEPSRQALLPQGPGPVSKSDLVLSNMIAGGVCGCLAAGVTTPFDVVKTRLQLGPSGPGRPSVWQVLRDIQRRQGVAGLFTGVGPRSMRAAPACAIVISVYEVLKSVLTSVQPVIEC